MTAAASPVAASEVTLKDGAGDMWFYTDADSWTPARTHSYGDIVRTTFAHRQRSVVVSTTFVELRRTGELDLDVLLRDDTGRRWELLYWTDPTQRQGRGQLFEVGPQGSDTGCDVSGAVDYVKETMRVSLDRSCLGDPTTLRFRSNVQHYLLDPGNNVYVDNPHDARPLPRRWTSEVRSG